MLPIFLSYEFAIETVGKCCPILSSEFLLIETGGNAVEIFGMNFC